MKRSEPGRGQVARPALGPAGYARPPRHQPVVDADAARRRRRQSLVALVVRPVPRRLPEQRSRSFNIPRSKKFPADTTRRRWCRTLRVPVWMMDFFFASRFARRRGLPVRGVERSADGVVPPAGPHRRQRHRPRHPLHAGPQLRRRPRRPGELAHLAHPPGLRTRHARR